MANASDGWAALDTELAQWTQAGRTATLWWRDDDAAASSAPLARLLDLAGKFSVPLALAIVPRLAVASLARLIGQAHNITPIVHGYAHINHAPIPEKHAEFGAHRELAVMRGELGDGLSILQDMFGESLLPVLVPPWNRLGDGLAASLPQLGYCGVSAFRPAANRMPAPGLVQTNCHIDPIDWHGMRSQRPASAVLEELITLLRARRLYPDIAADTLVLGKPIPASFDPEEPTGLLTHHLVQRADAWEFLSQLLLAIEPHYRMGAVRWLGCAEAFRQGAARSA